MSPGDALKALNKQFEIMLESGVSSIDEDVFGIAWECARSQTKHALLNMVRINLNDYIDHPERENPQQLDVVMARIIDFAFCYLQHPSEICFLIDLTLLGFEREHEKKLVADSMSRAAHASEYRSPSKIEAASLGYIGMNRYDKQRVDDALMIDVINDRAPRRLSQEIRDSATQAAKQRSKALGGSKRRQLQVGDPNRVGNDNEKDES
jgi:hypothetical protein